MKIPLYSRVDIQVGEIEYDGPVLMIPRHGGYRVFVFDVRTDDYVEKETKVVGLELNDD